MHGQSHTSLTYQNTATTTADKLCCCFKKFFKQHTKNVNQISPTNDNLIKPGNHQVEIQSQYKNSNTQDKAMPYQKPSKNINNIQEKLDDDQHFNSHKIENKLEVKKLPYELGFERNSKQSVSSMKISFPYDDKIEERSNTSKNGHNLLPNDIGNSSNQNVLSQAGLNDQKTIWKSKRSIIAESLKKQRSYKRLQTTIPNTVKVTSNRKRHSTNICGSYQNSTTVCRSYQNSSKFNHLRRPTFIQNKMIKRNSNGNLSCKMDSARSGNFERENDSKMWNESEFESQVWNQADIFQNQFNHTENSKTNPDQMELLERAIRNMDTGSIGKSQYSIEDFDIVLLDINFFLIEGNFDNGFAPILHLTNNYLFKEFDYPEELFNISEIDLMLYDNFKSHIILDLNNGNAIKLGKGKKILRCISGYTFQNYDEIREQYGPDMILEKFDDQKFTGDNIVFVDKYVYFSILTPIFIKIAELKKQKTYEIFNNKTYQEIYQEISMAINNCTLHDPNNHRDLLEWDLYSYIIENPDLFSNEIQSELVQILIDQKLKEKLVAIIGNSHYPQSNADIRAGFPNNVPTNIINQIFELRIQDANKPNFFLEDNPYYTCSPYFEDRVKNDWDGCFIKANENVYLLNGNVNELNNYFESLYGPDFKVLIIGSDIKSDLVYCLHDIRPQNWNCIFLNDQLRHIEEKLDASEIDLENERDNIQFGNAFFDFDENGEQVETAIYDLMKTRFERSFSSQYSPAFLEYIKINKTNNESGSDE